MRRALTVIDGILAGEDEGPLAPADRPLGVVIASLDPVAADLVATRLMGFDEDRIPKIREAMADSGPRITGVRSPKGVLVAESQRGSFEAEETSLSSLRAERAFRPHIGWRGHVERRAS